MTQSGKCGDITIGACSCPAGPACQELCRAEMSSKRATILPSKLPEPLSGPRYMYLAPSGSGLSGQGILFPSRTKHAETPTPHPPRLSRSATQFPFPASVSVRYRDGDDGRGRADAWRRRGWWAAVWMARQFPEPPVLVAAPQNHPRTALLDCLEQPKIAEALGAGLFVTEPVVVDSLRDAGEPAARALFRG